jgi:NADPH2:quinone reductase
VRAFVLPAFDAPPVLRQDLPDPAPADRALLVRVHASSVNPVDNAIASGMLKGMVDHEFPVVLGRDYAGVVEQVGPGTTRYAIGDEVFGFLTHANPTVHDGAWADLIVVPEDNFVAAKPEGVEPAEAGAAPLAGITAMLAVDALELSSEDTVLIVGATGGVGSFAVQLAARTGASVIAPALPDDETYLRDLGITELVDRGGDAVAAVRSSHPEGVDALLDLVSYAPEGFESYAAALKPGGRGTSRLGASGSGPERHDIMGVPSPENLERLAGLLRDGLTVPIQQSYDLASAGDALKALSATHKQGKVALRVA